MGEQTTTRLVRLYPTPEQAALLRAHCQDYIAAINVLTQAIDAGVLPEQASTKDFTAALPSAVKNQALRDARSVAKPARALGRLPRLRKPICHWNNQNWRLEGDHLALPVFQDGKVGQIALRCALPLPLAQEGTPGTPGLLRVKRKRGKWMAEITFSSPTLEPTTAQGVMGVDLGIKLPAVVHVIDKGARFFGNGREQRFRRRHFFRQRQALQQTDKIRAVKARQGKERRWMRAVNHTLSHRIVSHAQEQGVGVIRLEQLGGIRQRIMQHPPQRTARTSGGASDRHAAQRAATARKNNRMKNTWAFFQLTTFITYKAERLGIRVEAVDPAYTSQTCPACAARNKAADRRYVCATCGWQGHRDVVGAINISRRAPLTPVAGAHGDSARATGA
ncbi:MAG TPA: transposase [Ktedonobacterales bacterium]|nr:transposase [Ktedonobacterales bacterium]